MKRKMEVTLYLGLGTLLGMGIATYRTGMLSAVAQGEAPAAQAGAPEKKAPKEPGGVFSPPGTFEGGTVVPAPNEPPFKGKIGRTIGESTSDWPPLATAPKGAPNVLYIVLDDVGYAAL